MARIMATPLVRSWTRVLVVNTASALLPVILFAAFGKSSSFRDVLQSFGDSLVFANIIGTLAFITMHRVDCIFGRKRFPINWILRASTLVAVACVGTLLAGIVFMAAGRL